MIKMIINDILGMRRTIILGSTGMALLCLLGFYYLYLLPATEQMQRDLRDTRRDIASIEDVISGHKTAFETFSDQRIKYDKIVEQGFMKSQRRLELAKIFADLQEQSGLLNIRYDVLPAQIEENERADLIDHRMMLSRMTVEADAFMDADLMRFITLMEEKIPGHVRVTHFNVRRRTTLTQSILEQISEGEKPLLVQADMRVEWRNFVPQDMMPEEGGP